MKIRAVGTGSKFCRHPLSPPCWVVSSGDDLTIVGCPWTVVPAMERFGYSVDNISVITLLSPLYDQMAGLIQLAAIFRGSAKKPILAAPASLIAAVRQKVEPEIGYYLDESFSVKSISRLHIKEEYYSETITFVANYLDPRTPSFGVRFENAKIFLSGETTLNEDWLFKEMGCDAIFHCCNASEITSGKAPSVTELQDLPLYLQNKMWLYGYEKETEDLEQPFPMMYLPPGSWIFNSSRKNKLISKEIFIKQNSEKQLQRIKS